MNQSRSNSPVRVLIADDSVFMRAALSRMVESDESLVVVGTAQTGPDALTRITELQPDVVTLDLDMPGLGGLEVLRRVMRDAPRPIIVVSSHAQHGAEATLDALELGAFDCLAKQLSSSALDIIKMQEELVAKIKAAAQARTQPRPTGRTARPPQAPSGRGQVCPVPSIVAIGSSTGGPKALQQVLMSLPSDLPAGVVIVQHMPVGFTGPFAKRLDQTCRIHVVEAEDGMVVTPGWVYIARAGRHLTVRRLCSSEVAVRLSATTGDELHVPSVDVTMLSVAEVFRSQTMGIIMTGMGSDGASGMQAIFREGGLTIGQDEATCAVYGMPRACAEMGVLRRVVPLSGIHLEILSAFAPRKPR